MTFVSRLFSTSRNHNRSNSLGQLDSHSVTHSPMHPCTHSAIHSFIQSVVSANTRSAAAITIENDSIKLPEYRLESRYSCLLAAAIMRPASCPIPHAPFHMPQPVSTTFQSNFCAFSVLRIFAFLASKLVANVACVACHDPSTPIDLNLPPHPPTTSPLLLSVHISVHINFYCRPLQSAHNATQRNRNQTSIYECATVAVAVASCPVLLACSCCCGPVRKADICELLENAAFSFRFSCTLTQTQTRMQLVYISTSLPRAY